MTCHTKQLNDRPKSKKYFESLSQYIPGGTNSPVRSFKGLGLLPLIVERASGDRLYDADGNVYIDYCGSWGPMIHGHAHPEIVGAAQRRIALGTSFGISSTIEERLARLVVKHVPSIQKVRFVSSGTEATMTAARLARGYTQRDVIVKFAGHYHGHADFFLVQAGSGVFGLTPTSTSAGIPQDIIRNTVCLSFNDIDGVKQFLLAPENRNRIAGVILEPIAGNMGCVAAKPAFIKMLREVTQTIGAVLIFDEVITGFRVALGGAQQLYGVQPDLTCLGKIIGGGFPAAAFGGRSEIMDLLAPLGPVYQAGTLSGNPVAMEAGAKALEMLEEEGIYDELARKTSLIVDPVRDLLLSKQINACIQDVGSMFTLFFGCREVVDMEDAKRLNTEQFAHFFRYMFANGVYIPPAQYEAWFVSLAHVDENLERTRDLIMEYFSDPQNF